MTGKNETIWLVVNFGCLKTLKFDFIPGLIYLEASCLQQLYVQLWGCFLGLLRAVPTVICTYTLSLIPEASRNALSVASSFVNRCFSAEWAGSEKFTGKQREWILRLLFFFPQRTFAGHLLTKVSVGKISCVIRSILQALLLVVFSENPTFTSFWAPF